MLWERGSRTCKSTKLLTHDKTTYNMFVVHWPSLACKQKFFYLLFEFDFGEMEMVVVYRWSSIPMYFWFLSFTRYNFTNFVAFPILRWCKVFTVIMFQSIGFGHPFEKPYNPRTLMGWLDLQLDMIVNSMVLKHTNTQITCINNNLYL